MCVCVCVSVSACVCVYVHICVLIPACASVCISVCGSGFLSYRCVFTGNLGNASINMHPLPHRGAQKRFVRNAQCFPCMQSSLVVTKPSGCLVITWINGSGGAERRSSENRANTHLAAQPESREATKRRRGTPGGTQRRLVNQRGPARTKWAVHPRRPSPWRARWCAASLTTPTSPRGRPLHQKCPVTSTV